MLRSTSKFELNISVIIPSYNRCHQLKEAILSFISQDIDPDSYEIIICDNNSSDETREVVKGLKAQHDKIGIQYVHESRQGVHYARNTAAKIALGSILYFTDDDMIATSSLLSNLMKVFDLEPQIACATGQVLPKWEIDPPDWIIKHCNNALLSLISRPEHLIIANYDVGCYSCHQAIRRDVFFQTGGFHPENTAGEWIGDGETGLNKVIKSLGYSFAYTSSSVIYHCIPSARMTQAYLNKRLYNQGFCDSYSEFRCKSGQKKRELYRSIFDSLIRMLSQACFAALKRAARKDSWHVEMGYCYYYLAKVVYKIKLLRSPSWRRLVLRSDWLRDSSADIEVQH